MEKLNSDYVARYEYACSLVNLFFDRELAINAATSTNNDNLFDTGTAAQILFTSDYSKLVDEKVKTQITSQLNRLRNDQNNFIVPRIHGVLLDFWSILGKEFMDKMIENTANGIAAVGRIESSNATSDAIVKIIKDNPELLVFIMGSKLYQTEFIKAQKIKNLQKQQLSQ